MIHPDLVAELWTKTVWPDAGSRVPKNFPETGFIRTRTYPGPPRGTEDLRRTRFSAECHGPSGNAVQSDQIAANLAELVYRSVDPDVSWRGNFPLRLISYDGAEVIVANGRPLTTAAPIGTTPEGRSLYVIDIEIYWKEPSDG